MACRHKPRLGTLLVYIKRDKPELLNALSGKHRGFICKSCGKKIKLHEKSRKFYETVITIQAASFFVFFLLMVGSSPLQKWLMLVWFAYSIVVKYFKTVISIEVASLLIFLTSYLAASALQMHVWLALVGCAYSIVLAVIEDIYLLHYAQYKMVEDGDC